MQNFSILCLSCDFYRIFHNIISRFHCFFSGSAWCKLAYWEEGRRVGEQYPVWASHLDIFTKLPKGNGLCLTSLFSHNKNPTYDTRRTREKIGQGKFNLFDSHNNQL